MAQWSVVVRAVSLDVDPTDALAKLRASGPLLLLAVGAAFGVAAARGLQQGVVWQRLGLVEQGVQSLLVDPGFWKLHLRGGGGGNYPAGELRLDSNIKATSKQQTPGVNDDASQTRSSSAHLGLLLLSGVHNGGAADLGQLASLPVERPAANLIPDHVFDEEDAAVEAERQPVEQLDVLQQVVVRVTGESKEAKKRCVVYLAARAPGSLLYWKQCGHLMKELINRVCNGGSRGDGGGLWEHVSYLV